MSQRPVLRWLARGIRVLTITPSRSMLLKDVVRHVRDGGLVEIFPEGELAPFVTVAKVWHAAAVIVARCGSTVIPVHIEGIRVTRYAVRSTLWPRPWFPTLTIRVGQRAVMPPVGGYGRDARRARAFDLRCAMQNMLGGEGDRHTLFEAFADAVRL